MQIFYLKRLDETHAILEGDEAKHCAKVLRHKVGDTLHAIDGQGNKYTGRITDINPQKVELTLLERVSQWGEHDFSIRLGVSLLRLKDRFEWILEKSVELGVTEFVPLICERTYKYSGKWKQQRLDKIVMAATKQCKRSKIMHLANPVPFSEYLNEEKAQVKLVAYCEATTPIQDFRENIEASKHISMLIGPEGDFSSREMEKAIVQGFQSISFGENRLRTETAAIFGLSFIKFSKGF